MSLKCCLFIVLFITMSAAGASPNVVLHCPPQIYVTQQLRSNVSGWQLFTPPAVNALSGIELYEGVPEQRASLKPDSTSLKKAEWHFQRMSNIYVVCQYNATSLQLTQPLPQTTIGCTLWYNLMIQGDHGFIPDRLVCRTRS